jgi:hypothetical protein
MQLSKKKKAANGIVRKVSTMPNRQKRNEGPKSFGFLTNQDAARPPTRIFV